MDQVAAKRTELKSVFEANEDGKYTSEQKEEIKSRNDELAELVEDLSIEKKKAQNERMQRNITKLIPRRCFGGC